MSGSFVLEGDLPPWSGGLLFSSGWSSPDLLLLMWEPVGSRGGGVQMTSGRRTNQGRHGHICSSVMDPSMLVMGMVVWAGLVSLLYAHLKMLTLVSQVVAAIVSKYCSTRHGFFVVATRFFFCNSFLYLLPSSSILLHNFVC